MSQPVLVYATRKSPLALAQSRAFANTVLQANAGLTIEELTVVTTGDRVQDRPLADVGGKGLFVKEIEEALLERRADIAVHSMKDVPAELPAGLELLCIPKREDPRDVLVAPRFGTLAQLPQGARVGTGSARRKLALLRLRPDLQVLPLRGNVDTRLGKADSGELDAVVLAGAGLNRLSLGHRATDWLDPQSFVPAVAQGALGIEARGDDARVRAWLESVHHIETALCVEAERAVMRALGGDCHTPLGVHAVREGAQMQLRAWVSSPDGQAYREGTRLAAWPASASEARALGTSLGEELAAP